jgi:hypothetical protein
LFSASFIYKRFLSGIVFFAAAAAFCDVPADMPVTAADPYAIDSSALKGNVVQVAVYKGPELDTLVQKKLSTFEKGLITSELQYDEKGVEISGNLYTYSPDGLQTEIQGTGADGVLKWKYTYRYDDRSRLLEENSYDGSGNLEWKKEYTYTGQNLLAEQITYNADDSVNLKEKFEYNARGFVSAAVSQYSDGKLLKRVLYTYTKGGHRASEQYYDATGLYDQIGYSYTADGKLTSFSSTGADQQIKSRTFLSYGADGNVSREQVCDKDGMVRMDITYVYDDKGNWIWKYDGTVYVLRKITYGA